MARSPINHSFYGQGPLAPLSGRSQQGGYSPSMQMAQQLMQDGSSMAPVQSVTEGAARALRGGLGGYMNYATMKAMGDEQKLTGEQTNAILQAMIPSDAVEGQDARPETLIPGGNPHTMGASEMYNGWGGGANMTPEQRVQTMEQNDWNKANTSLGADGYAGAVSPAREAIAAQPAQSAMQNALTASAGIQDPTAATTAMGQQLMMARANQDWQTAQLAEERAYEAGLLSEERAFNIANPGAGATGRPSSGIQLSDKYDSILEKQGKGAADAWYMKFVDPLYLNTGEGFVPRANPSGGALVPITPKASEQPAFKGEVAGTVAAATDAVEASTDALKMFGTVNTNIANLGDAIAALDKGANTGAINSLLPSMQTATIELENVRNRLGLDVIGSVTFGALSQGELDLAMTTAMPTNLQPAALREWLVGKKDAQQKLAQYYNDAGIFLGQPGNTRAMWAEQRKTAMNGGGDTVVDDSPLTAEEADELKALRKKAGLPE